MDSFSKYLLDADEECGYATGSWCEKCDGYEESDYVVASGEPIPIPDACKKCVVDEMSGQGFSVGNILKGLQSFRKKYNNGTQDHDIPLITQVEAVKSAYQTNCKVFGAGVIRQEGPELTKAAFLRHISNCRKSCRVMRDCFTAHMSVPVREVCFEFINFFDRQLAVLASSVNLYNRNKDWAAESEINPSRQRRKDRRSVAFSCCVSGESQGDFVIVEAEAQGDTCPELSHIYPKCTATPNSAWALNMQMIMRGKTAPQEIRNLINTPSGHSPVITNREDIEGPDVNLALNVPRIYVNPSAAAEWAATDEYVPERVDAIAQGDELAVVRDRCVGGLKHLHRWCVDQGWEYCDPVNVYCIRWSCNCVDVYSDQSCAPIIVDKPLPEFKPKPRDINSFSFEQFNNDFKRKYVGDVRVPNPKCDYSKCKRVRVAESKSSGDNYLMDYECGCMEIQNSRGEVPLVIACSQGDSKESEFLNEIKPASLLNKGASMFGNMARSALGIPKGQDAPAIIKPTIGHMAHVDIPHEVRYLSFNTKYSMSEQSSVIDQDHDPECSILRRCMVPSYLTGLIWQPTQSSGTMIATIPVTPCLPPRSSPAFMIHSNLSYYSSFFAFWRGELEYEFEVVCTPIHQGQLFIAFQPGSNQSMTIQQAANCLSASIDLSATKDRKCVMRIPYVSNMDYRNCSIVPFNINTFQYSNYTKDDPTGNICVFIQNPLTAPPAAPQQVELLISIRATESFQFALPRNSSYYVNLDGTPQGDDEVIEDLTNVAEPGELLQNLKISRNPLSAVTTWQSADTENVLGRKYLFKPGIVSWDTSMTTGTWTSIINFPADILSDTNLAFSGLLDYHYLTRFGCEFTFTFAASSFYAGRAIVFYDPTGLAITNNASWATIRNLPHTEFEPASENNLKLTIPWASVYRNNGGKLSWSNGQVYFGAIAPLMVPQGGVQSIGVTCWIKPLAPYVAVKAVKGTAQGDEHVIGGTLPIKEDFKLDAGFMGDHMSIIALLKRPEPVLTINGNLPWVVNPPSSPAATQWNISPTNGPNHLKLMMTYAFWSGARRVAFQHCVDYTANALMYCRLGVAQIRTPFSTSQINGIDLGYFGGVTAVKIGKEYSSEIEVPYYYPLPVRMTPQSGQGSIPENEATVIIGTDLNYSTYNTSTIVRIPFFSVGDDFNLYFPMYMPTTVPGPSSVTGNGVIVDADQQGDCLSCSSWVRDLTQEGVEPNPGPAQSRFVRPDGSELKPQVVRSTNVDNSSDIETELQFVIESEVKKGPSGLNGLARRCADILINRAAEPYIVNVKSKAADLQKYLLDSILPAVTWVCDVIINIYVIFTSESRVMTTMAAASLATKLYRAGKFGDRLLKQLNEVIDSPIPNFATAQGDSDSFNLAFFENLGLDKKKSIIYGLSCVIVTGLVGIVGKSVSSEHTKRVGKWTLGGTLSETACNLGKLGNGVKGVSTLWDACKTIVSKVFDWFFKGDSIFSDWYDDIKPKLVKWVTDWDNFKTAGKLEAKRLYHSETDGKLNIHRLNTYFLEIAKEVRANGPLVKYFPNTYLRIAEEIVQKAASCAEKVKECVNRVEPVGVCVTGDPGCGKSYLSSTLLPSMVLKLAGIYRDAEHLRNQIYCKPRDPEQKFMDGYTNQPWVVVDDWAQATDDLDFLDIINLISCTLCPVNMADMTDKNTVFDSAFVVCSTNRTSFVNASTVVSVEAVIRRFKVNLRMRVVKPAKTLNVPGLTAELRGIATNPDYKDMPITEAIDRVCAKHFVLEEWDFRPTGANNTSPKQLPLSAVAKMIADTYLTRGRVHMESNRTMSDICDVLANSVGVVAQGDSDTESESEEECIITLDSCDSVQERELLEEARRRNEFDERMRQMGMFGNALNPLRTDGGDVILPKRVRMEDVRGNTYTMEPGVMTIDEVETMTTTVIREDRDERRAYTYKGLYTNAAPFLTECREQMKNGRDPEVIKVLREEYTANKLRWGYQSAAQLYVAEPDVYNYLFTKLGDKRDDFEWEGFVGMMYMRFFQGIVAVSGIYLIYRVLKMLVSQLFSYFFKNEPQAGYDKSVRREFRGKILKAKGVVFQGEDVVDKHISIVHNTVRCQIRYENDSVWGMNALALDYRHIVMPWHFYQRWQAECDGTNKCEIACIDRRGEPIGFQPISLTPGNVTRLRAPAVFNRRTVDCCLIRLVGVNLNHMRKISHFIPNDQFWASLSGSVQEGQLLGANDMGCRATCSFVNPYLWNDSLCCVYKLDVPTVGGDCGRVCVLAGAQVNQPILGIHVAKCSSYSGEFMFAPLSSNSIQDAMGVLDSFTRSVVIIDEPLLEPEVEIQGEPNPYHNTGMSNYGQASENGVSLSHFSPPKTDLCRTTIQHPEWDDSFEPTAKRSAIVCGEGIHPLYTNSQKYVATNKSVPTAECQNIVTQFYLKNIPSGEGETWDDFTTINGDGISQRVVMSTSTGFIAKWFKDGKKELFDPDPQEFDEAGQALPITYHFSQAAKERVIPLWNCSFVDRVRACEKELANGQALRTYWVSTLKDELREFKKILLCKTRVFEQPSFEYAFLVRKYFGSFLSWFRSRAGFKLMHGIGNDKDAVWKHYWTVLNRFGGQGFDLDFTNYDGTVQVGAFDFFLAVTDKFYGDNDRVARHALIRSLCNSLHVVGQDFCESYQGNKSGNPMTDVFNSITNVWFLLNCYLVCKFNATCVLSIDDFYDNVRALTYGDDVIIGVSDRVKEWFNRESCARVGSELGMTVTSAAKDGKMIPYESLQNLTFLKSPFVEQGDMILAPLPVKVIHHILRWQHKANRGDVTVFKQRVDEACELMVHHGRDKYDVLIRQLREVGVEVEDRYAEFLMRIREKQFACQLCDVGEVRDFIPVAEHIEEAVEVTAIAQGDSEPLSVASFRRKAEFPALVTSRVVGYQLNYPRDTVRTLFSFSFLDLFAYFMYNFRLVYSFDDMYVLACIKV